MFSTSAGAFKGLTPDSEDPQPKEAEEHDTPDVPTQISNEQYHELSDIYMNNMVAKLEQLQEARDDVDVEYSV